MENPLSLNLPPCEAFLPSWLRFSLFSLTSVNTLVTLQDFQLSPMLVVSQFLCCWFNNVHFVAFYAFSLGEQNTEEGVKVCSPAWLPGMPDRPVPHAFLRPPEEAEVWVSFTSKWSSRTLSLFIISYIVKLKFPSLSQTLKADHLQTFWDYWMNFHTEVSLLKRNVWWRLYWRHEKAAGCTAHIAVCILLSVTVSTLLLCGS